MRDSAILKKTRISLRFNEDKVKVENEEAYDQDNEGNSVRFGL